MGMLVDVVPQKIIITKNGNATLSGLHEDVIDRNAEPVHAANFSPDYENELAYIAPEICREKPSSHASTIWSLGCLLHHLCEKRPPFRARNIIEMVKAITRDQ